MAMAESEVEVEAGGLVNINKEDKEMVEQQQPKNMAEDIEFQVSQVIGRLEEASVGKAGGEPPSPILELPKYNPKEIIDQLQDLLRNEEEDGEEEPVNQLSPHVRMSLVSHAITVYTSCLDRSQAIATRVSSDTTRWITQLFRMPDYGAYYHDDQREGMVRVARSLLHARYPRYMEEGYEVLKGRPPVIYSNLAAPIGIVHHICRQLGLPFHCVRGVPGMTIFGSRQKMDVAALERLVQEDENSGRLPLMVLADAGTPIAGHVDNLSRLQEICRNYKLWLHLRGHTLAALTMATTSNSHVYISDSLTLPLGLWLGVPGLPSVTLYNQSALSGVSAGLHEHRKLISLPLWTVLQSFGKEGIQQKILQAFESSEQLYRRLVKYPCLRMSSQQPGGEGGAISMGDLVSNPVTTNMLLEVVASSVVFQFVPEGCTERVPPYYDKLNSWLEQILQREAPQVPLEICELESCGVVLRYCPLEVASAISVIDLDAFINCLEQQLEILQATVVHKETFQQLVQASPQLELVEMPGWAGLGGVRYIPCGWEDLLLTDQAKEELNRLNVQLVEKLRITDAAFSLGEGTDGLACVRFGMVTAHTDVAELLSLFQTVGKEEEESWKFIDTMAEVVKKGIQAAMQDLQKESEERLWQDGILRQVPVFGSLVNWWSPPNKEGGSGIKGRSLDLTAGVVASTENIYRYHMQGSASVAKEPPSVVTPVAGHSRTSSVASQQSNAAAN